MNGYLLIWVIQGDNIKRATESNYRDSKVKYITAYLWMMNKLWVWEKSINLPLLSFYQLIKYFSPISSKGKENKAMITILQCSMPLSGKILFITLSKMKYLLRSLICLSSWETLKIIINFLIFFYSSHKLVRIIWLLNVLP